MADDDERGYFVVHTGPRKESLAACDLKRKGFAVWWWSYMADEPYGRRGVRRRSRRVLRSWYPRYLFVRASPRVDMINEAMGVSTVLYLDARPFEISCEVLNHLARVVGAEEDGYIVAGEKNPVPKITAGSKFRFADGSPFYGNDIIAEIAADAPLDGSGQISAYLYALGRRVLVKLTPSEIGEIVHRAPDRSPTPWEPETGAPAEVARPKKRA